MGRTRTLLFGALSVGIVLSVTLMVSVLTGSGSPPEKAVINFVQGGEKLASLTLGREKDLSDMNDNIKREIRDITTSATREYRNIRRDQRATENAFRRKRDSLKRRIEELKRMAREKKRMPGARGPPGKQVVFALHLHFFSKNLFQGVRGFPGVRG